MSAARQVMGRKGERVAEKWLNVHGWEIAERRFRNGRRDIDLVATRADVRAPAEPWRSSR